MILSKLHRKYFGPDISLQNKIFNVECFSLTALLLQNILIFLFFKTHYFFILSYALLIVFYIISFIITNKTKQVNLYATIICILSNLSMIPYALLIGANQMLYLYFIIGIVFVILLFEKNMRKILLIVEIVLYVSIVLFSNHFSNQINELDIIKDNNVIVEDNEYVYNFITVMNLTVVIFSLSLCILTVLETYQQQNEQLNDMNKYLTDISSKDSLTGLWNRKYMDECLLESIKKKYKELSIIILDIDNFKKVNDDYGHLIGDEILKEVAQMIKENVDHYCTPTRYGGEEFLIILPNIDINKAYRIAENIRVSVYKRVFIPNTNKNITISGGISSTNKNRKINELIDEADQKLYKAKKEGRNKIVK
ncbi:MAG: GGDEF domain-containing protein [Bacilli bacterium]|nr:GGDEF domain-containing protein [Bacilli bacterium]